MASLTAQSRMLGQMLIGRAWRDSGKEAGQGASTKGAREDPTGQDSQIQEHQERSAERSPPGDIRVTREEWNAVWAFVDSLRERLLLAEEALRLQSHLHGERATL